MLVHDINATLITIARDTKIQIEFNPVVVGEYRLIGYENRLLNREDFANDRVDAGDIGAGHTVTALYDLALTGVGGGQLSSLRYGSAPIGEAGRSDELGYLQIRYKLPGEARSRAIETALLTRDIRNSLEGTSDTFRFPAAVAAFGQLLRQSRYAGHYHYDDVLALARASRGDDAFGYRGEFLKLVDLAKSLGGG